MSMHPLHISQHGAHSRPVLGGGATDGSQQGLLLPLNLARQRHADRGRRPHGNRQDEGLGGDQSRSANQISESNKPILYIHLICSNCRWWHYGQTHQIREAAQCGAQSHEKSERQAAARDDNRQGVRRSLAQLPAKVSQ